MSLNFFKKKGSEISTRGLVLLTVDKYQDIPIALFAYHDLVMFNFFYNNQFYQNHIQLNTKGEVYKDQILYTQKSLQDAGFILLQNARASVDLLMGKKSKVKEPTKSLGKK